MSKKKEASNKPKTKKIKTIEQLEKLLIANDIYIGTLPDNGGRLHVSAGGCFRSGGYGIGADMYEENLCRKSRPFHWCKKSILEFSGLPELKCEDFSSDESFIKAEYGTLDEVEGWGGFEFGDVLCVRYGYVLSVYDEETGDYIEYDPNKHNDPDEEAWLEGGDTLMLVHIGDRVFIEAKSVTKKIFEAIKALAVLHESTTKLRHIDIKVDHWDGWKDLINK